MCLKLIANMDVSDLYKIASKSMQDEIDIIDSKIAYDLANFDGSSLSTVEELALPPTVKNDEPSIRVEKLCDKFLELVLDEYGVDVQSNFNKIDSFFNNILQKFVENNDKSDDDDNRDIDHSEFAVGEDNDNDNDTITITITILQMLKASI